MQAANNSSPTFIRFKKGLAKIKLKIVMILIRMTALSNPWKAILRASAISLAP